MSWLSRPKVLLGLLVNATYLLYCLAAPAHRRTTDPYRLKHEARAAAARRAPAYVPLAPPSEPSEATSYYAKESGQLNIYLTNDLTLVRRPGHTLLLSPALTVWGNGGEPPHSILLRFVSFSDAQHFDDDSPLDITADGDLKWSRDPLAEGYRAPSEARARHSVTMQDGSQVVETLGEVIPYETFLEVISARRVIVTLGPDSVELTADQIEALRGMHRLLPQPPPPAETGAGY